MSVAGDMNQQRIYEATKDTCNCGHKLHKKGCTAKGCDCPESKRTNNNMYAADNINNGGYSVGDGYYKVNHD